MWSATQLDVGVLAAADRDQQVALGDDARRRRLGVADQRRAGPLLDHQLRRPRAACATARRSASISDIPSLTCICVLLSASRCRDSADRLKTTRIASASTARFRGRLRHIDSGPPRSRMHSRLSTHPPAARPRRPGGRRRGRVRLRDDAAPTSTRGRTLFVQKCGVCHTLAAGRDDRRRSAPTSTTPSPRRARPARAATRSKGSSRRRSSTRARATATPPSRCRRDVVTGQDLDDVAAYVGDVRRRARRGAAGSAGRPRRPGLRQQRLRRLPHARRRRARAASPAPNLDEVLPGQTRGDGRRSRSSTRTRKSPRATRPT